MQHKPKIGRDFPVNKAVIDAHTNLLREAIRAQIALMLTAALFISLFCAFAISLATWDFGYLKTTWAMVAAPLGGVIVHYFDSKRANDKDNDESST